VLAAVNVTVWGAFSTEKDNGVALSPEGKPETVIATAPLKPFRGVIETWKVDEVPGAIAGVDGVDTTLNDGDGGGGGWPVWPPDPPPQPANVSPKQRMTQSERPLSIHHSGLP